MSTRRVYTEKIIEQSTETTKKTETSTTSQDEISETVKEDNKTDLKLGASLTVNQSWGTGNATATASLNMENTLQSYKAVVTGQPDIGTQINDVLDKSKMDGMWDLLVDPEGTELTMLS